MKSEQGKGELPLGPEDPSARIPRNVWGLTATSFLTDVSSEMIFNLLPLYLANALGARTAFIGLIEGVGQSTASLLKIGSGWLSDHVRSRKPLTVAGYGVSTLAKVALSLASSWPVVLVIRFVERAGKGLRTAPRDALVAASVDEESRGRAFGLHRAGDTAGAFIGVLAAYFLVRRLQAGALELSATTFRTLVLVSVVPAALAVLVLLIAVRERRAGSESPLGRELEWPTLDRRMRGFLLAVAVFSLGNSADAFLVLRAQTVGLGVDRVLLVLVLFNAVYSLVAEPAGEWSDRWGRIRILIIGWLLYAGIYLGLALAERPWQLYALMGGYGLYYGLTEGTSRALVADLSPESERGTAYGAYHTVVGVMALPASLLAGVLWQGLGSWQGWGPGAPFAAGALLALGATALLALASRGFGPSPSGPTRESTGAT
jgi:MFS family permease